MEKKKKNAGAMNYDLTHARHDRMHCLTPGLFRSLKRGERKKLKLDVTYTYGEGESVHFWGPEPLGADDLRVLQGLIAMAAVSGDLGRGIMLRRDTESTAGKQLRLFLDLQWDAIEKDAMVAKGSFRNLAYELGYTDIGGKQLKTIQASIKRLYAVSIFIEKDGKKCSSRILSEYASDEREGKLFVALNPRLAKAIAFGGKKDPETERIYQYTRIEMAEVRTLQADPARLIHQRLCGQIDPGKLKHFGLDTLCGYVWPDETNNPNTLKKRRQTIKKALAELSAAGWKVTEYTKGKWEIDRPKLTENQPPPPMERL